MLFKLGSRRKRRDEASLAERLEADPFGKIFQTTDQHRRAHGCRTYPFKDGPLLGVLARMLDAKRILEIGTALGYSTLWFAYGAKNARIETFEIDAEHARIAREHFAQYGYGDRIEVIQKDFNTVVNSLTPPYDIVFFDGHAPAESDLKIFHRLLRPGGLLITENLHVGGDSTRAYREKLFKNPEWLSAIINNKFGLSLRD